MTVIIHPASARQGYSTARYILRNHSWHDLEAIDAAFDVLAHSMDEDDKALCRVVADEMWLVPSPSPVLAVATTAVMALAGFGVVTLLAGLVQ